jgi:hypothetical protein
MDLPEGLSPEDSKRLTELRDALISEFKDSEEGKASKNALTDLEELKGDMLTALKGVLRHSHDEKLKARVAMWGYSLLVDLGKTKGDKLADLLSGVPAPAERE